MEDAMGGPNDLPDGGPESPELQALQQLLEREIPMTVQMGLRVRSSGLQGLMVEMPLERNRNHHHTAFAGSLNALCTIAGWGATYLQVRSMGLGDRASIVIRRSSIKYRRPVERPVVQARSHPLPPELLAHFVAMLTEKGQAKLDVIVEVPGGDGPDVAFAGSYVVQLSDFAGKSDWLD